MDLQQLVTPDRVACDQRVSSKKRALERLSGLLATAADCSAPEQIFDSLVARERLGSTGLGGGVALPHARLPGLERPLGAVLRTSEGVDFDALDGQRVTLMFGLLVPEALEQAHLEILARLAEIFRDEAFCMALRQANDARSLLSVLCSSDLTPPPTRA